MVAVHRARGADITLAMHPVSRAEALTKGIASVHPASGRVLRFEEKPEAAGLDALARLGAPPGEEFLASMGIYIFSRKALLRCGGGEAGRGVGGAEGQC